jgi:hypothetical protein
MGLQVLVGEAHVFVDPIVFGVLIPPVVTGKNFLEFDNSVTLKKTTLGTSCLERGKDSSVLITIRLNYHENLAEVILGKVTLGGDQVVWKPTNYLRSVELRSIL